MTANPARGEAEIVISGVPHLVRPSFAALVAAESELGPLLALVDRAAEGGLLLAEMAGLLWHCQAERPNDLGRADWNEALIAGGISVMLPALRTILRQIVVGGS